MTSRFAIECLYLKKKVGEVWSVRDLRYPSESPWSVITDTIFVFEGGLEASNLEDW